MPVQIKAQFPTAAGAITTGLTPTINTRRSDTDAVVDSGSMTEVGVTGLYTFNFTEGNGYDVDLSWYFEIDGTASAPAAVRRQLAKISKDERADVAFAVLEEPLADHLTAGSAGLQVARQAFRGFIWVDPGGTAGTTYPTGTEAQPVSNFTDAFAISTTFDINRFMIQGDLTIPAGRTDAEFRGVDADVELDLDGQNLDGSVIQGLSLKGSAAGADLFLFDCILQSVTNFVGRCTRCRLEGTLTIANGESEFLNCFSSEPGPSMTPIVNMGGATAVFGFRGYNGGIQIGGMAAVGNVGSIDMVAGQVILAATDSAGVVTLRGIGNLTNSSTGTTVEQEAFINLPDIQSRILSDATPFQGADIPIIRGLVQQNFLLDNTTHNSSGLLTTGRIRIFDIAANVPAAGGGSETTGLLATFNISAVGEGANPGLVDFYRVVKV